MPRGKKSKARSREKRSQGQEEIQEQKDVQASATKQDKASPDSAQASGDAVPNSGKAPAAPAIGKDAIPKRAGEGCKGRGEGRARLCGASSATSSPQSDVLTRKIRMLMEFMLFKYKMKQPIRKGEMLKIINKRFKEQFPEILTKASHRLDMVFGLELEELMPNGQSYMLVNKLDFQDDGSSYNNLGLPTKGILIPLLSVIYLNGKCAPEEEIWHFLNVLGIHDGSPHIIFGDVRKLVTEDLVQEKYLVYRQVPDSDPPSYEFLWGPRAYDEHSKVKVMEFLAKVSANVSRVKSSDYEELFEEEKDKVEAAGASGSRTKGKAKRHGKVKSS